MAKLELLEPADGSKILHVAAESDSDVKILETFWRVAKFGPGGILLHGGTMSPENTYIRIETQRRS